MVIKAIIIIIEILAWSCVPILGSSISAGSNPAHSMPYGHCMYKNSATNVPTHAFPFLLPNLHHLLSPRLKLAGGSCPSPLLHIARRPTSTTSPLSSHVGGFASTCLGLFVQLKGLCQAMSGCASSFVLEFRCAARPRRREGMRGNRLQSPPCFLRIHLCISAFCLDEGGC